MPCLYTATDATWEKQSKITKLLAFLPNPFQKKIHLGLALPCEEFGELTFLKHNLHLSAETAAAGSLEDEILPQDSMLVFSFCLWMSLRMGNLF